MPGIDIESELVAHLRASLDLGTNRVGTKVPADVENRLPFVQVSALPGVVESRSWDRRVGVDRLDVDVDVFASTKVQARDAARDVWAVLHRPLASGAAVLDRAPMLTARPDRNENVRRYGAVVSYLAR